MTGPMTFEDILSEKGELLYTTSGTSMFPLLRDRTDVVRIIPVNEIRKYDVVLFKRNRDYVLHRVIKILPDGYYIRGDNCFTGENVKREQIIGVLSGFVRNGKQKTVTDLSYLLYSYGIVFLHPALFFGKGIIYRIKRIVRHGN